MGKTSDYQKADIQFNVGDKPIKFSVIHNLPDTFGLSFEGAFDNWLFRTDKYTAESLCKYINSKNTGYECMTEKEYNERTK